MQAKRHGIHARRRLISKIAVWVLLGCICFLRIPVIALAQEAGDAEYAGSTNVQAYVVAAPEDTPENVPENNSDNNSKKNEPDKDMDGTNVQTGDESGVVIGLIVLMLSGVIFLCRAKGKRRN